MVVLPTPNGPFNHTITATSASREKTSNVESRRSSQLLSPSQPEQSRFIRVTLSASRWYIRSRRGSQPPTRSGEESVEAVGLGVPAPLRLDPGPAGGAEAAGQRWVPE